MLLRVFDGSAPAVQMISLVCLAIGLKYIHGEGTKAWRDSYVRVILFAMVALQVSHPSHLVPYDL